MQQQLLDIIFKEDEITWKDVIVNLIKTNQIDPWDVDIIWLTKEYIKMLKKLKELDFKVSGKVLLAAAILLRIKSDRLLEEDIAMFDSLMNAVDEQDIEEFYNEMEHYGHEFSFGEGENGEKIPQLIPRTPQLKKRRVSIYDLMNALEGALETTSVRSAVVRTKKSDMKIPDIKFDIGKVIVAMSDKLKKVFKNRKSVSFTELLPGQEKEDKVYTIMPLLHLAHIDYRLIDLEQKGQFSEIIVKKASTDNS